MNRERSTLLIIIAVIVVLACIVVPLVGVGGYLLLIRTRSATSTAAIAQQSPAPAATSLSQPGPSATAVSKRPKGGELRLPGSMPPTLDPAQSTDSTSAGYIVEIFSGLVTLDPDLQLVPDIAQSYEISQDGRTYRFHLRQNVRFHNGRAVKASDVSYSLERSCSPSTGSPVAATYLGDIVGARDMLAGRADHLAGVKVVDDYTVDVQIDAPRASFLAKLSHPVAYVVDRNSIGSSDPVKAANGTGPFKLTEFKENDHITLQANTNYYREPKPALDRVVFQLAAGDPVTMYENDELDIAPVGTGALPRVQDPQSGLSEQLSITEQMATFYIGLNCQLPPFNDVKVRQAFAQALDRQRIVDNLYDKTVPAATTIVPPTMPGYSISGLHAPAYDVAAAKQSLSQSSYGSADKLPPITLHVSSASPQTDPTAAAIAALLKENLGLDITIEQSDWPTFLGELNKPKNPFQMYVLGWIADYPDPENFLNLLFHTGSADNHSRYSNTEVDKLLDQAGLEMDAQKRAGLYEQAERLILADAPVIPLYHDVEYWLTKPYVKGMHYPAMVVPRFQYVYIEKGG
jgi:oligopeptide transport system substrate-binding protein